MAAYIDGRRLGWGGRSRLEKHFADCDRCFTLLRDIMDFRDSDEGRDVPDAVPDASSRSRFVAMPVGASRGAPRFKWLGVGVGLGGVATIAAALLVVFVMRGPAAGPSLDPLIVAMGTQRVTDARLAGFGYGPRPEVMRSIEPTASAPSISLEARGAATKIQEEAAAKTTPAARHAVGVSRLISGDVNTAVADLQQSVIDEPTNVSYVSDLAAAFITRGIRNQNPDDLRQGLERAEEALARSSHHPEALFNRALALESLGQRDAARAAWEAYLQFDASSAWAAEARQHLASTR